MMWVGFIFIGIISGLMFSNAEIVSVDRQRNGTNRHVPWGSNAENVSDFREITGTSRSDTCSLIGGINSDQQLNGCPAEIPLKEVYYKTILAARTYDGFGNDVPSLACNGACYDQTAETKFSAPEGRGYPFGSIIINPGCSMYVFSDYNYRGTSKRFDAGVYVNIQKEAPFLECGGMFCASSMLFTCQQVFPSCTPSSAWQTVSTLDNTESTVASVFSYKKTVGTKFSQAMTTSFGSSVTVKESMEESFYSIFKEDTSISATIHFDWSKLDTEETSTDTTYTVNVTLPPGLKVHIDEVVGTCGGSKIHTQMFRVMNSNTTLHIHNGKMSNFVVNTGKIYSMGSTSAYGTTSKVVTGFGHCCPKITVWGNLDPEKNGIYLNVGRWQIYEIPNECNSPCIYVKQNSLKNSEYCFGDSWTSQSKCETMDNGPGSGSNVG